MVWPWLPMARMLDALTPDLASSAIGRLGEQVTQLHIQLTFAFNLIRAGLHERLDGVAYRNREGMLVRGQQGKLAVDGDRDERGINSVYARSGHEADVVHAASFRQARAAGKRFLRPVFAAARQGMLW